MFPKKGGLAPRGSSAKLETFCMRLPNEGRDHRDAHKEKIIQSGGALSELPTETDSLQRCKTTATTRKIAELLRCSC